MQINELQKHWNMLGHVDPLWAVLSHPDKKGNKWQIDEFFKNGKELIGKLMEYLESSDSTFQRRKALDFGCGVGRLSQGLAEYYDEVHGVDIAKSMLELAEKYNRHGDKCHFHLNTENNLNLFSDNSFDLIFTLLTLQHIEPKYSKNYIKEFLRVLAPKGLLIFQIPSEKIEGSEDRKAGKKFKRLLRDICPGALWNFFGKIRFAVGKRPKIEMYSIKREEVVKFLEENGGRILEVVDTQKIDERKDTNWVNFIYRVTKD